MHAATPMWRNGRRNGLKIEVFAVSLLFFLYIKSSAVYLGKSVEFSFCDGCRRASRNGLILAQILAHGRDEFQVRVGSLLATLYKPAKML